MEVGFSQLYHILVKIARIRINFIKKIGCKPNFLIQKYDEILKIRLFK